MHVNEKDAIVFFPLSFVRFLRRECIVRFRYGLFRRIEEGSLLFYTVTMLRYGRISTEPREFGQISLEIFLQLPEFLAYLPKVFKVRSEASRNFLQRTRSFLCSFVRRGFFVQEHVLLSKRILLYNLIIYTLTQPLY